MSGTRRVLTKDWAKGAALAVSFLALSTGMALAKTR